MIRKYAEIFCWKNVSSFCSAKATHIFSAKNIRILYIESTKTVKEMTLNELVKPTTLWTTGPWFAKPCGLPRRIFMRCSVRKTYYMACRVFFISKPTRYILKESELDLTGTFDRFSAIWYKGNEKGGWAGGGVGGGVAKFVSSVCSPALKIPSEKGVYFNWSKFFPFAVDAFF